MNYNDLFTPEEQQLHYDLVTPYLSEWWRRVAAVRNGSSGASHIETTAPLHMYSAMIANTRSIMALEPLISKILSIEKNARAQGNDEISKAANQLRKEVIEQVITANDNLKFCEEMFAEMTKEVSNG